MAQAPDLAIDTSAVASTGAVAAINASKKFEAAPAANYCALVEQSPALGNYVGEAIIGISATGLVNSWNPAAETIYGRSAGEALGEQVSTLVGTRVDPAAIVASGGIEHFVHRAAAGHTLEVRVSASAMDDGFVLVCSDLGALRRVERHFESVVMSMVEGVIVLDKDGYIKSMNPAAMAMMGIGNEYVGSPFFALTDQLPFYDLEGVSIPPQRRPVLAVMRTGVPRFNEVFGIDRTDGRRRWLMSSCRLLDPDLRGQSDVVISFVDVTAEREAVDEVMFYATRDALTGLPNRASVLRKINKGLEPHTADRLRAVLFIDLDDLKAVNDTRGHAFGDHMLRAAAQRLLRAVGRGDVVGRFGGDEFVILVFVDIDDREIVDLIEDVRFELATPLATDALGGPIQASIGAVEIRRDDARTADEILHAADLAMYDAKRLRRSGRH
jgi:diguanylate cyclase (GGDEF)-like protein